MTATPWLSLSIWVPILFGLVILGAGRDRNAAVIRTVALVGSVLAFAVTLPLVTGFDASSAQLQFVENGLAAGAPEDVVSDPQSFTLTRPGHPDGTTRVRAEALVDDAGEIVPRTITSYVWLHAAVDEGGCDCRQGAAGSAAAALIPLLVLLRAKRIFNYLRR